MQYGDKDYNLRISDGLLTLLAINNISVNKALVFFAEQIEAMQNVEPNFAPNGRRLSKFKKTTSQIPCWVMRGYFPDSTAFFKVVLIHKKEGFAYSNAPYYAKITCPIFKPNITGLKWVYGSSLKPYAAEAKADQALLGADEPLKEFGMLNKVKKPRCMSPKGVKVFSLKKRRKRAAV